MSEPITFDLPSWALLDVEQNAVLTTQWGSLAIFNTKIVAEQWAAKSGKRLKIVAVRIQPLIEH